MEKYKKHQKLADILFDNHLLLPVINRFGVQLGLREKSVEDICTDQNIDVEFFLAIINSFTNRNYFPESKLLSYSPLLIIDYLRKTHQYYISFSEPKMAHLLGELIKSCTGDCKELDMIKSFYDKYTQELFSHIKDEDQNVFPYVEAVCNTYASGGKIPGAYSKYNIATFEKEHTNVEEKLSDLKNLIIKYIKPVYDENLCFEFLSALFNFERDLNDHARIEDRILVPQVMAIEKGLRNA